MPVHEILHDDLNTDMLQVVVHRIVSGVITQRQIEQIIGRLEVGVTGHETGEGSTAYRPAGRNAAIVDIGRRGLRVEEMRVVIDKTRHAPRPVAPAQTAAIMHSDCSLRADGDLLAIVDIAMEGVYDRGA